jgi:hypothetical protein
VTDDLQKALRTCKRKVRYETKVQADASAAERGQRAYYCRFNGARHYHRATIHRCGLCGDDLGSAFRHGHLKSGFHKQCYQLQRATPEDRQKAREGLTRAGKFDERYERLFALLAEGTP